MPNRLRHVLALFLRVTQETIVAPLKNKLPPRHELFHKSFAFVLLFSIFAYYLNFPLYTLGATYTFTQTNWLGGITENTAVHASNQSGWTEFSASTTGMTTANSGADAQLAALASTTVETSDADFNAGSHSSTVVSGGGVQLSSTSYRRVITVDNSSNANTLSDYQVKVTLNTAELISAGKMQSACQDVRFYDSNGTTAISYWIESGCNTTSTTIWAKVPSISGSASKTIYMNYGDGAALDQSSAANVMVFYDPITNADNWTGWGSPAGAIDATVGNSAPSLKGNGDGTYESGLVQNISTSYAGKAYIFESKKGATTYGVAGRVGNGGLSKNATGNSGEWFDGLAWIKFRSGETNNRAYQIYASDNSVESSLEGWEDTSWHKYEIAVEQSFGKVRFWVDGTLKWTSTKNINNTNGYIAFSGHDPQYWFDNVWVRNYSYPEPSASVAAETGVYVSSGTFTSRIIDSTSVISWGTISWTASGGQTVTMKARSSANSNMSGATDWASCAGITSGQALSTGNCVTNGHRYIQYQASLSTSDTGQTPSLDDVTISYTTYSSSSSLTSSKYDSSDTANVIGSLSWTEDASLPSGTGVTVSLRTASAVADLDNASWTDFTNATTNCTKSTGTVTCSAAAIPAAMKNGSGDRWLQYKVTLASDGTNTPTVSDVNVQYVVNATPNFDATYGTNGVTVSQISDTADANYGKVSIAYRVRDTDTSSGTNSPGYVTPSFKYNIGGEWVTITSQYLNAGATDNKSVDGSSYTTYTAYWDARSQTANQYLATAQVQVTVDDNEGANRTASADSGNFTLDTTDVTVTEFRFDSSTDKIWLRLSDDTNLQYKLSNDSNLVADGTNAISGEWQTVGAATASTSIDWTPTGSQGEKIWMVVRDSYGNTATTSTVAPASPTNVDMKDVSNASGGVYRLFISWDTYTATSSATFSKYQLYRSTDGSSYSQLTSITDSDTNYYTDISVASTTTYYYKLRVLDTNGDVSSYSSVVSDQPDGQGGTDATAPTISSITVASSSATWAKITWTTDELSNSFVDYSASPSTAFGSTASSSSMVTSHSVTITGLQPDTTYLYQIRSQDIVNNQRTSNNSGAGHSFTTTSGTVISSVTAESVADNSAVIFWNTNTDANSYVLYATDTATLNNGGGTEAGSASLVGATAGSALFQHRVSLSSLTENTTYYYYVRSTDGDSNTVNDTNGGAYYSFKTTYDTKGPTISSISTPVITTNTVVVVWLTDEKADGKVQYGTASGSYPSETTLDSTLTNSHVATIQSLSASTKYYYKIVSKDAQSNSTSSSEQEVTTTSSGTTVVSSGGGGGASIDYAAPKISNVKIKDIGAFSATVTFDTDELTTGYALFGKTASYGDTAGSSDFGTSHSIKLKGLSLGSEYQFKAKAVDRGGNAHSSDNQKFTTKFAAEALEELVTLENASGFQDRLERIIENVMPSLVPPFIGRIEVADVTENSAKVKWKTNVPTFGSVAYTSDANFKADAENSYETEISQTESKTVDHEVVITGLSPGTVYHYQIRGFSFPGVLGKSPDATFITKASKIKPEITRVGNTEIEIRWSTADNASSYVEYVNQATGKVGQVGDSLHAKSHLIELENLTPNTSYQIRAYGYDGNNSLIESSLMVVRTKRDSVAPVLSLIRVDNALLPGRSDRLQTVVSWKTDEPASSEVYYEEGYGTAAPVTNKAFQNEFSTDHIVIIAAFKPSTIYRLQVFSKDESGNVSSSTVNTILTPNSAETVVDVILKNLEETFGFLKRLR